MKYIRKSNDRGQVNIGWLQSQHSFSFGQYYDPKHMGVSVLRVINDDVIMPGKGFGEHGHNDMEIITYVIEGALQHKDSTGNKYTVNPGDVQRMSAGSGVSHSEFNASSTEKVKLLQIWIQPSVVGIKPSYEQKHIAQQGALTPLVTPTGVKGALSMNQNAHLSRLVLQENDEYTLETQLNIGYLHIVKGSVLVDGETFKVGDAFAIEAHQALAVKATNNLEALWFDLP